MKKIFALLIGISFICFSCQVKEEITFEIDGSGKISTSIDFSSMKDFMTGLKDEFKSENSSEDSLKNSKHVDSIFYFSKIIEENKDSLSEEEYQKLSKLKDYYFHIKFSEEESFMSLNTDFKKIEEVGDGFNEVMAAEKNLKGKKKKSTDKLDLPTPEVSYSFTNKKFSKVVTPITLNRKQKQELKEMKESDFELFGEDSYKVIYHFPEKVKKINIKDAVISKDKKTVTITRNFEDYLSKPEDFSIEVTFK